MHHESGAVESMGDVTTVIRKEDCVLRSSGQWTPAVHSLLRHLEAIGFDAAPRVHGIDDEGREVLTWMAGEVVSAPRPDVFGIAELHEVGTLIRRMHDATAGFVLPAGVAWGHAPEMEVPGEIVICHNDLAPKNLVLRGGRPAAIIDWDLAGPNPRVWDLAHALWQFTPLGDDSARPDAGWTTTPSLAQRIARAQVLLDGYGLGQDQRAGMAGVVALRMQRTHDGIDTLAAGGNPAIVRLRDRGVLEEIVRDREWVLLHADQFDAGISERGPIDPPRA